MVSCICVIEGPRRVHLAWRLKYFRLDVSCLHFITGFLDCAGLQGKYEERIEMSEMAIQLDPNLAVAWNNKGEALKLLGRTTEASAAYAKAKELGYNG